MSTSSNHSPSSLPTQTQGLFPGYQHVERFGPDEDYDDDEVEECYVTLDLGSIDQTLVPSSSSYRLVGLDTTPLMQISRTIMRGHYKTLIGTELIFKDVSEETDPDVSLPNNQKGNIQYFTKTDRRIQFREVELKPKSGDSSSQEQQKQQGQRVAAQAPLSTSKRKFSSMALESLLSGSTASSAGDPLGNSDTVIGVQGEVPHAHEEARTEGDALQSREAIAATRSATTSDAARINEADGQAMDVDQ